jgi:hypothetical protein
MRKITINDWQIGLLLKDGAYQKYLSAGSYWIGSKKSVKIFELTEQFLPPVELNILLKDEGLSEKFQVVDVKDNQLVLLFVNGLLKEVLIPGRYCFWKSVVQYEFLYVDISKAEITEITDRSILMSKVLAPFVRVYAVESYEKAVLLVDGKFSQVLDSGVYFWWKNAIPIYVNKVDARQLQLEINGQEILTRDKAALRLNAWSQYAVADVEKALLQNKEFEKQLYIGLQLVLREFVAGYSFDELLEKKESLSAFVLDKINVQAEKLGVAVFAFGIRDIILPGDIKEIMNRVMVAEKQAQANSIMRREETASTRSLLNTAKLMEENAMLWKLKEMEYVEKIAEKISSISVNGNSALADQLKQLFVPAK